MPNAKDWHDAKATYFAYPRRCEECGRDVRVFVTAMFRQRFEGYQAMHVACWKRLCQPKPTTTKKKRSRK